MASQLVSWSQTSTSFGHKTQTRWSPQLCRWIQQQNINPHHQATEKMIGLHSGTPDPAPRCVDRKTIRRALVAWSPTQRYQKEPSRTKQHRAKQHRTKKEERKTESEQNHKRHLHVKLAEWLGRYLCKWVWCLAAAFPQSLRVARRGWSVYILTRFPLIERAREGNQKRDGIVNEAPKGVIAIHFFSCPHILTTSPTASSSTAVESLHFHVPLRFDQID